jgi:hypothetical protein
MCLIRCGPPTNLISKLLGTPFKLDFKYAHVDEFLLEKVEWKLRYWSSTKLSFAKRKVVMNIILLLSLWYFVNVGEGLSKELMRSQG